MSSDESYSSSSYNLSLHSISSNESASINTSSSSEMHMQDSFTSIDSNLDNLTEIISDEFLKMQSGLYDISVDISIQIPRFETFNKTDILRAAVYTICGDIFFKHAEWNSISSLIAIQMGRSLNPTSSSWIPVKDKRLMYLGKTTIAGHTYAVDEHRALPLVYDSMSYSGKICATNIKLSYFVNVFLTPGIAAAEKIYKNHGFKSNYDDCTYTTRHIEDISKGHRAEKLKCYNHHLAWACVYNVLEEHRENISKQNKFIEEYGFSF